MIPPPLWTCAVGSKKEGVCVPTALVASQALDKRKPEA